MLGKCCSDFGRLRPTLDGCESFDPHARRQLTPLVYLQTLFGNQLAPDAKDAIGPSGGTKPLAQGSPQRTPRARAAGANHFKASRAYFDVA